MAKGVSVGIGGAVRNVKGIYIGVGGSVRKVKSGYVGIGGVVKQFFSSEVSVTKYTGTITPTDINSRLYDYNDRSMSINEYAIFAGSRNDPMYIYDISLVRSSMTNIGATYWDGIHTNSHAIEIGVNGNSYTNKGYAYNESLSVTTITFSTTRFGLFIGRTSDGNYALRMGGYTSASAGVTSAVLSINTSLTVASVSSLKVAVQQGSATNAGNYCICYGGRAGTSSSSAYSNQLTFYDNSLTRTTGTFSDARINSSHASTGLYGIIIGGYIPTSSSIYLKDVKYFDGSLTLGELGSLTYDERSGNGCSIPDKEIAIFSSGMQDQTNTNITCWYYNSSLTKEDLEPVVPDMNVPSMQYIKKYCILSGSDGIGAYEIS